MKSAVKYIVCVAMWAVKKWCRPFLFYFSTSSACARAGPSVGMVKRRLREKAFFLGF